MCETVYVRANLTFDRPMENTVRTFLKDFCDAKHIQRNVQEIFKNVPDWKAKGLFGTLGVHGEFYTGKDNYGVQSNNPPYTQPTHYCGWKMGIPYNREENKLIWNTYDQGENEPDDVVSWLIYLILNVFEPLGYLVSGKFVASKSGCPTLEVEVKYNKLSVVEL